MKTTCAFNFTKTDTNSEVSLYPSYKWVNNTGYATETAYRNYDFVDEEGYYNSVYVDYQETTLYWTKFNESNDVISTISWPLYYPKDNSMFYFLSFPFGGAIYYNEHLYVLYTQPAFGDTYEEQYGKNVFALGKYDKKGNLIALKEYKGIDLNTSLNYESEGTQIPFYGTSSISMTAKDGVIGIFYGRNSFNSHESSKISFFDANTLDHLTHLDSSTTDVPFKVRQKYFTLGIHSISHSLGQRMITTSDGGYLLVEAGDAGIIRTDVDDPNSAFFSTRGVMLSKIYDEYYPKPDINAFKITTRKIINYSEAAQGKNGNNILNSSLGNIIELSDGYLYVGAMEKELNGAFADDINAPHQLVVQKIKKDFYTKDNAKDMVMLNTPIRKVTGEKATGSGTYLKGDEEDYGLKFLTNLTDRSIIMSRAIKMDNDNVAIIWEQDKIEMSPLGYELDDDDYETYFMVIDSSANVLIAPTKLENATMSGVQNYVYKDSCIYWTSTENRVITVNRLNPFDVIESVSFDKKEVSLAYNTSMKLNVQINPSNTKMDKTLKYISSNNSIVTVTEDGTITAKYPGTAIITVSTVNNKTAQIKVTVTGTAPFLKGDMNKNGEIDLTDVLILLKLYFNKNITNDYYMTAGDMNSNNEIDLTDILILLKNYFGNV